ncbi:histidine triad (HIT) family protein [Thermosporothrix hazakensis]|jgi:histidine triad (HIT) family protein|uniref:Histidine triad (HIT) family protein n=1 Tax=Thermosporothrix hazakensis TaxID=644383 RepID=A0A326U596_THEHA|nr:HIT family protein [Thermosporothrix hazakensis]PZW27505.1 histidine triad (HIT) family protein [Thermosporothrix hazakensis]GCE45671.1 HIT family protein [Thermosporothrix hazakensis]
MSECIFCDIIAGKAPASMVYQDDQVCAFMTIGPINPGHVLIVPTQHFEKLTDMDEETGARLFAVTMRVAKALRRSGLRCEGLNLFLAEGEVAFQSVFHAHIHIIPRFSGDGFALLVEEKEPPREELDQIAVQLREALEARGMPENNKAIQE